MSYQPNLALPSPNPTPNRISNKNTAKRQIERYKMKQNTRGWEMHAVYLEKLPKS